MSTFKEQPEEGTGLALSDNVTNQDSTLEPFVLVTRKKHGRQARQTSTSVSSLPTTNTSQVAAHDAGNSLPGWGSQKPTKIKKNSRRAKMLGLHGSGLAQKTIEAGLSMIGDRVMTLKQSKFYHAFQELVQTTLHPPCQRDSHTMDDNSKEKTPPVFPASMEKETTTSLKSAIAPDQESNKCGHNEADHRAVTDMVFYGIGSIESSRNSQFQMALGLCLKEILQISGTMAIFDPVMTEYDKQLAEQLGFNVLKVNDQARQVFHTKTLLYMPHCPKGLYSHVLEANWSRKHLDNIVILGNRFTMYDERQHVKQAPFILPALSIAHITLFPKVSFEDNTIFNDLAFHCFPSVMTVPDVDILDREKDPELL